MTGEELKRLQRERALSDRAFLDLLGIGAGDGARRRLRRWKAGELAIPPHVEAAALKLSVDRHA